MRVRTHTAKLLRAETEGLTRLSTEFHSPQLDTLNMCRPGCSMVCGMPRRCETNTIRTRSGPNSITLNGEKFMSRDTGLILNPASRPTGRSPTGRPSTPHQPTRVAEDSSPSMALHITLTCGSTGRIWVIPRATSLRIRLMSPICGDSRPTT